MNGPRAELLGSNDREFSLNPQNFQPTHARAFSLEVQKNSHEKFLLSVDGGIIRIGLWRANGRGAYLPTPNVLAFSRRHLPAIRKLLDECEGDK